MQFVDNRVKFLCPNFLVYIIENATIGYIAYEFLFAFHSNYGTILYRLQNIVTYWSKITRFYTPPVFSAPAACDPVGILWRCLILIKLEWFGYRMVKKLWQHVKQFSSDTGTLQIDSQMDRQRDRQNCYINIVVTHDKRSSWNHVMSLRLMLFTTHLCHLSKQSTIWSSLQKSAIFIVSCI